MDYLLSLVGKDNKEQIYYLRNKADQKCDVIEDMENEMNRMEQKYKEAKNEIELKEKELNPLDNITTLHKIRHADHYHISVKQRQLLVIGFCLPQEKAKAEAMSGRLYIHNKQ